MTFFRIVLGEVKRAAPKLEALKFLRLIKSEEIADMVESIDDIPKFWFDDGEGKPYLSTDRRNVWCYERCVSDENLITQKDIFNPAAWPYEEVD